MLVNNLKDISQLWVAGISYKKTDASARGKFAIQTNEYLTLLDAAKKAGLNELFVLSTCNRTEIYGFAESSFQLVNLLTKETLGTKEAFLESAYIKNGYDAIYHLFNVSAGLDSQILGDYEIIGQIKASVKLAKEQDCVDAFFERLINTVLQASKAIKNQTELSGGTVSVSFAAIQCIRENVKFLPGKKILLVGTGKIGKSTCKNLVDYLDTKDITLINRTSEKARELATELELNWAPIEDMQDHISASDIILVATDSAEPIVHTHHLQTASKKLIIDLSIPYNVDPRVKDLEQVILVNVDELAKMKDDTLARREAEVPKAKEIISTHIAEFKEWYEMRKHVPVLKAMKTKLKEIHNSPLFIPLYNNTTHTEEKIQKVINGMAFKMKEQNQKGCHYIEAINEFIATGTTN